VESIEADINGKDDQYWQYYVNDELPMIGCDAFVVENGDTILWIFEKVPSKI